MHDQTRGQKTSKIQKSGGGSYGPESTPVVQNCSFHPFRKHSVGEVGTFPWSNQIVLVWDFAWNILYLDTSNYGYKYFDSYTDEAREALVKEGGDEVLCCPHFLQTAESLLLRYYAGLQEWLNSICCAYSTSANSTSAHMPAIFWRLNIIGAFPAKLLMFHYVSAIGQGSWYVKRNVSYQAFESPPPGWIDGVRDTA